MHIKTLAIAALLSASLALPAVSQEVDETFFMTDHSADAFLISIFNPEPGISQFWRDEMAKDHGTPHQPAPGMQPGKCYDGYALIFDGQLVEVTCPPDMQ